MSPQVTFIRKRCITLITRVWFGITMHRHMSNQICLNRKGFLTLIARVWSLTSMNSDMHHQVTLQGKWFLTLITFVWFVTCMYSDMCYQVTLLRKWSHTLITLVEQISAQFQGNRSDCDTSTNFGIHVTLGLLFEKRALATWKFQYGGHCRPFSKMDAIKLYFSHKMRPGGPISIMLVLNSTNITMGSSNLQLKKSLGEYKNQIK
jgi:hypothetical protein